MPTHRYKHFGPKNSTISSTIGTTVTSTQASPLKVRTATISDDLYLNDLDAEMETQQWIRDESVPEALPTVLRVALAKLSSDASAVSTTTWTDVSGLSCDVTTTGDSTLKIEVSCQAGVAIGGGMRALINGGSFSNVVIATNDYPLLAGNAPGCITTYMDLPASSQTYTVKIQVSAALLGSVTPRAGSALTLTELLIP